MHSDGVVGAATCVVVQYSRSITPTLTNTVQLLGLGASYADQLARLSYIAEDLKHAGFTAKEIVEADASGAFDGMRQLFPAQVAGCGLLVA